MINNKLKKLDTDFECFPMFHAKIALKFLAKIFINVQPRFWQEKFIPYFVVIK
jgi:hypothetical protein